MNRLTLLKQNLKETHSVSKWRPKQFLSDCAIMLIYAKDLKTAQPISIWFSLKDAVLIFRQLPKKKKEEGETFFTRFNWRSGNKILGPTGPCPPPLYT